MKNRKCAVIILVILLAFGLSSLASAKDASSEKTIQVLKGKFNINTATDKELKMLPGIGKKTVANINGKTDKAGTKAHCVSSKKNILCGKKSIL